MIVEKLSQMTTMLEIFILSLAISLDSFMSAFGYGTSKIKIHLLSAFVMSLTGTIMLVGSCLIGSLTSGVLSQTAVKYIAFSLLLAVGIFKLGCEIFKSILQRKVKKGKEAKLKIFGKTIDFEKSVDITKLDADNNKILSPIESFGLGFILSIDSLGVGLSYGLQNQLQILLFGISFIFSLISIVLGNFLGKKLAKTSKINLSYLSGIVLIALAISKLFI